MYLSKRWLPSRELINVRLEFENRVEFENRANARVHFVFLYVFCFYVIYGLVACDRNITFREIGEVRVFPFDFVNSVAASI